MRRRGFITLLGAAAAWPIAAFAQQRLPRVGVLLNGRAVPPGDLQIAAELTRIGYIEGRNIAYEIRGAEGDVTRLPALARELAAVRPEVLFGSTAQIAVALFNATREIPIVITTLSDPIALGLSTSMSRPTRNVTGFTISNLSLAAKRLEILHEVVPASSRLSLGATKPFGCIVRIECPTCGAGSWHQPGRAATDFGSRYCWCFCARR
jgi:putative ABC transport system substrate-binding protein